MKRMRESSKQSRVKTRKMLDEYESPLNEKDKEVSIIISHVRFTIIILSIFIFQPVILNYLQEEIIKKLMRPFKCPVPNYVASYSNKTLGCRRNSVRRSLYDPDTPNALVLFRAPELTEHDKLKSNV